MNLLLFAGVVTATRIGLAHGTVDAIGRASNFTLDFSVLSGSENLCSPRKLSVYNDHIYIAEAGIGPRSTNAQDLKFCYQSVDRGGAPVCLGPTSKVSKLPAAGGARTDLITGLVSNRAISGPVDHHAVGAESVLVDPNCSGKGRRDECLYVVLGLIENATKFRLDDIDNKVGAYGAIVEYNDNTWTTWVSVWEDEYANNYENSSGPPRSHPVHLLINNDKFYTVDASCNCVLVYERNKKTGKESGKDPFVLVLKDLKGLKALTVATDRFGFCKGVTPPLGPKVCGQYQDSKTGEWLYDVVFAPIAIRMRPGHRNKIYVAAWAQAPFTEPAAQIYEFILDSRGYPRAETSQLMPGGPYWSLYDFFFTDDGDTMYVMDTNPGFPTIPFDGNLVKVSLVRGGGSSVPVHIKSSVDKTITSFKEPSGILIHKSHIYVTDNTFHPSDAEGVCDGRILVARLPSPGKKGIPVGEGKKEGKKERHP